MSETKLVCCTDTLLREIAEPTLHQRDVAQTYRLAMESDECERVDWAAVNAAIVKRWSKAGLLRVKTMAWSGKCFAARK